MLTIINTPNPCSPNAVNAANACMACSGTKLLVQTQSGLEAVNVKVPVEEVVPKLFEREHHLKKSHFPLLTTPSLCTYIVNLLN